MRFPLLTAATTAATFFFLAPSGNTQVQAHKSTDKEFSTLVVNTDTLPPTGADTMMYAVKKLVHGGQDAATTIALARMDEANAAIEKRTGVPLTDLTNSAQIFLRPITVKVIPTGSPEVDSAFTQYALQFEKEFNTAVTLPRDTIFNRLKRAA